MRLKLAPSILSAHFERLGEDVRAVEEAGADQIHVDVMDGHFVPNLSMGPVVVEALRRATKLHLDVHLMITNPEKYLEAFVKAGANHITFHIETVREPARLAQWLHERKIGAGLALNPETPVQGALDLLASFDMLLIMTVHPGFGGQSFLGENLEKVREARAFERRSAARARELDVEVDGGIDASTAVLARDAGANVFVAGSSIFGAKDPRDAARALKSSLESSPARGKDSCHAR